MFTLITVYICTYKDSKLLANVHGPFEQSNLRSTLDFCPRPARKVTKVPLYNWLFRILQHVILVSCIWHVRSNTLSKMDLGQFCSPETFKLEIWMSFIWITLANSHNSLIKTNWYKRVAAAYLGALPATETSCVTQLFQTENCPNCNPTKICNLPMIPNWS